VFNDTGNGGYYEKDMANHRDRDRDANGLVATPVCVGHIGTEKRDDVDPRKRF
jgi:hypothetical protein